MNNAMFAQQDERLVEKWAPVLEGVSDEYTQKVTAQLLENQAKAIVSERVDESADFSDGTTLGKLGTFQKYAFPLVRRVYPELLANKIVGVQPMSGPVSQIFYLGHSRHHGATSTDQTIYSKFNLTYRGLTAEPIGTRPEGSLVGDQGTMDGATNTGLDGDIAAANGFDVSNVLGGVSSTFEGGMPSATYGGKVASFPSASSILGFSPSAGERLSGNEIPELSFHIQQQAVASRTRKMRALWTIEASQDLKAYHNLDLEKELTGLLGKELRLEIDRELIEDLRMISYGITSQTGSTLGNDGYGGFSMAELDRNNPNNLVGGGGTESDASVHIRGQGDAFVPGRFDYDFHDRGESITRGSNVFVLDFTQSSMSFSPRHIGDVYANMLALINIASQDIYKTTMRGPGTWVLTSPLIASFLESSAKLQGGMDRSDAPTNNSGRSIEYKGKFAGKYDLYVDPMYPTDEIMIGYKGDNAMDAGYVYAPYIPLQQLPTVTDPETFQPRKGILTRYGKAALQPADRFYRIIRIIGPTSNYLLQPFARNDKNTFGAGDIEAPSVTGF